MPQSTITSWFKKPLKSWDKALKNELNEDEISYTMTKPKVQHEAGLSGKGNKSITARESSESTLYTASFNSSNKQIPSNAHIQQVTETTLPEFRRLNQLLLPIPYPHKFYADILTDAVTSSLTLAALWQDNISSDAQLVAGIRCRLLASSPSSITDRTDERPSLYIASIGTLAPYRGHGLALALMNRVIASAIELYGIGTITAHVWEANEEGRAWYAKLGYKEVHYEAMYYGRLKPNGAYVLERRVKTSDLLNSRLNDP